MWSVHFHPTNYGPDTVPSFSESGVSVNYDDSGQGEPVILLHRAGTTRRQWSDLAGKLLSKHRGLAPDMIGFGESDPR